MTLRVRTHRHERALAGPGPQRYFPEAEANQRGCPAPSPAGIWGHAHAACALPRGVGSDLRPHSGVASDAGQLDHGGPWPSSSGSLQPPFPPSSFGATWEGSDLHPATCTLGPQHPGEPTAVETVSGNKEQQDGDVDHGGDVGGRPPSPGAGCCSTVAAPLSRPGGPRPRPTPRPSVSKHRPRLAPADHIRQPLAELRLPVRPRGAPSSLELLQAAH